MIRMTPALRVLVNALLAGTMLRLFGLDRFSLWLDEGVTWSHATLPSVRDTVFAETNHPPAWWLVTRGWIALFGDSELSLRLPAAVLGVVSVGLAFLFARRLTDPLRTPRRGSFLGVDGGAAPWVVGFAAAGAFWIEWSQEARMYSALLAESLGLSLLYLRWQDGGERWTLAAYAALAAVALYTHYFAALFLAGHAVHALLVARSGGPNGTRLSPGPVLAALAVAGALFLPWFVHLLQSHTGFAANTRDPLGRIAHVLWRIGVGPGLVASDASRAASEWPEVVRDNLGIIVPSALLWGVPVFLGVRATWRDRGARAFLLSAVLVPIAIDLAVFPWFPLIEDKYFVFLAPPLLVLAVVGARTAGRYLRPVLLAGLVVLTGAALLAYHAPGVDFVDRALTRGHPHGKEQWREAREGVAERWQPGDLVLLHQPYLRLVWDYYERDASKRRLLPSEPVDADRLAAEVPELRTAKGVFLVFGHDTPEERDRYVKAVRDVMFKSVVEAGSGRVDFSRPVRLLPRQWGVRVHEFRRE
jgi:uncharacterized membrane protein